MTSRLRRAPQAWPEDLNAGKRIVVIGSGATAVTLVPAWPAAAHVTMLQRSPTYMASLPEEAQCGAPAQLLPPRKAGTAAKWFHALVAQAFYQVSRRYPKLVRRMLLKGLARQLPPGFDIATHFTPHYDPWDQRFCAAPDGDFFKSIRRDVIGRHRPHRAIHRAGAVAHLGRELEADIIVSATGLELLFLGALRSAGACRRPRRGSPTRG